MVLKSLKTGENTRWYGVRAGLQFLNFTGKID